jgi:hypothetical protein
MSFIKEAQDTENKILLKGELDRADLIVDTLMLLAGNDYYKMKQNGLNAYIGDENTEHWEPILEGTSNNSHKNLIDAILYYTSIHDAHSLIDAEKSHRKEEDEQEEDFSTDELSDIAKNE